jgi:Ca2+/Na+ antiporter
MHRTLAAGLGLLAASLAGYLVGVSASYPGRAFAISGVMVGVALVAVGVAVPDTATTAAAEADR